MNDPWAKCQISNAIDSFDEGTSSDAKAISIGIMTAGLLISRAIDGAVELESESSITYHLSNLCQTMWDIAE